MLSCRVGEDVAATDRGYEQSPPLCVCVPLCDNRARAKGVQAHK